MKEEKKTGEGKKRKRPAGFSFVAVATLAVFLASSQRAEAGDPRRIPELIAEIVTLEMSLMLLEYLNVNVLKEEMEQERDRVTAWAAYYDFMVQRDKRIEQEYQDDHAMLKDIVWTDRTLDIQDLYNQMAQHHAQSFAGSVDAAQFLELNPGYRTSGADYVHFSQIYKDRAAEWSDYAKGVLDANVREAQSVVLFQPAGIGIAGLKDASVKAEGYMQLLQAGNQIYNMSGQLVERLRIDVNRQTEARARFALDERQEKTDEHAALNQAIRWKNQTQGKDY